MNTTKKRSRIKIFARLRPTFDVESGKMVNIPDEENQQKLLFNIPKDTKENESGLVNNTREQYEFMFNKVFGPMSRQEEVFNDVVKKMVYSALDGVNSTVFAYGQTGSGKTYTMTGPDSVSELERGLIPRALNLLFNEFAKRSGDEYVFSASASFMEIYNENGYDLLPLEPQPGKQLDDLPKVHLFEDEEGKYHLRNLSEHKIVHERDAMKLLDIGTRNRMSSDTALNHCSSRSHCVFTISIQARRTNSNIVRRSKLRLVDLAGSERVDKVVHDGTRRNSSGPDAGKYPDMESVKANNNILTRETKYINLSLHYLESVIVTLQKRPPNSRTHVPYRNSMLTAVLRDSLGGNCKTVMIATLRQEDYHVEESLSTCRFAQRVAMVANEYGTNEELDIHSAYKSLKAENARLKKQLLTMHNGGAIDPQKMTIEDRHACTEMVESFVKEEGISLHNADRSRIAEYFNVFKVMILQLQDEKKSLEHNLAVLSRKNVKILQQTTELENRLYSPPVNAGPGRLGNTSMHMIQHIRDEESDEDVIYNTISSIQGTTQGRNSVDAKSVASRMSPTATTDMGLQKSFESVQTEGSEVVELQPQPRRKKAGRHPAKASKEPRFNEVDAVKLYENSTVAKMLRNARGALEKEFPSLQKRKKNSASINVTH